MRSMQSTPVALDDRPPVCAAAAAMAPAVLEESSAVAEVQRLSRLAHRPESRPGELDADPIERLQAIAELPAAQRRAALAQAEGLRTRRDWETVRAAERDALERERQPARLEMQREFYAEAETLRAIVRRIAEYDATTVALGGRQPEGFWIAEFGPSSGYVTALVDFRRERDGL